MSVFHGFVFAQTSHVKQKEAGILEYRLTPEYNGVADLETRRVLARSFARAEYLPPCRVHRFVLLVRFSYFVCLLLFSFSFLLRCLFHFPFDFHILQPGSSEQTANPKEQPLNKTDNGLGASDIANASERVREVSVVLKFRSSAVISRNGQDNLT